MALTPRQIEIHIKELVLHGVAPAERRAVIAALTQELEALVARHGVEGLLSRPEGFAPPRPGPIVIAPGARPETLGARIAHTIYQGWR